MFVNSIIYFKLTIIFVPTKYQFMFAQFKTLPQLFDFFKDEETCISYWENIHWGATGIVCPHCKSGNPYKTNRGYKCKNVECQKKFTAFVGTIFENSKLPLRTWFGAL